MNNLAILSLGNIETHIEVENISNGFHNDSPSSKVTIMLEQQMKPLIDTAQFIAEQIKLVSPDELELNFGIKATGEGGFLCFAKAGVEAQFNVTMKWNKFKHLQNSSNSN